MTGHVTLWRPRPGRVDRKHQDIRLQPWAYQDEEGWVYRGYFGYSGHADTIFLHGVDRVHDPFYVWKPMSDR